jgi:hypothetical protein
LTREKVQPAGPAEPRRAVSSDRRASPNSLFDLGGQSRYTVPMTTELHIPPALEHLVRRQLTSGRFQTATEVIAEGLRLLEEKTRPTRDPGDHAFGLWKGRFSDGLAYERQLRAEWDR